MKRYGRAIVKWNGGNGALLCNHCMLIIDEGLDQNDVEHYCDECKSEGIDNWKDALTKKYAHMFAAGGYPAVGGGWRDLVERCLFRIEWARGDGVVRIHQIKEKFGGIRIYAGGKNAGDAGVCEAIDLAEMRSLCTCEDCGDEGRLYDRAGWYLTRCMRHAQGQPVVQKYPRLRVVTSWGDGGKRVTTCRSYDRELDVFVPAKFPADYNE